MSQNYHSLVDEFKNRIKNDFIVESTKENKDLIDLPYPYVTPGKEKHGALFYWDTYFINYGLIKTNMVNEAKQNVENLLVLLKKYGFIPASNHVSMLNHSSLPLLPWMVRDIYRATGDKEWLRRHIKDVVKEFSFWTTKPHTTPSGLYRYIAGENAEWPPEKAAAAESGWIGSSRFDDARNFNPVDLNAILYRNAKIIYDLQIEAEGSGDEKLLEKSNQIKKIFSMLWDDSENFYFDNDYVSKTLGSVKTLAGFTPLFVEMVNENIAKKLYQKVSEFVAPGGLYLTKTNNGAKSIWEYPLLTAPYIYFVVKGLCDNEYMEDAADIGTNWLDMVIDIYEKTGELWEWYNVEEKSNKFDGVKNTPVMGWTMGTFVALLDSLGL